MYSASCGRGNRNTDAQFGETGAETGGRSFRKMYYGGVCMKHSKRRVMALLIAIVMILAGSIGAHFVNTSGGTVKVSRIAFDTDKR